MTQIGDMFKRAMHELTLSDLNNTHLTTWLLLIGRSVNIRVTSYEELGPDPDCHEMVLTMPRVKASNYVR